MARAKKAKKTRRKKNAKRLPEAGKNYWGQTVAAKAPVPEGKPKHDANGYVIYRGPSMLTGKPIVCIATGFVNESDNEKTGPMIQTWILVDGMTPQEAIWSGEDVSVCGVCVHRGVSVHVSELPKTTQKPRNKQQEWKSVGRSCYVVISKRPTNVYDDYRNGLYPEVSLAQLPELFRGQRLRIGSYGDPVAVPAEVWEAALTYLTAPKSKTGYTHQWCLPFAQRYRHFLQASVDSLEDYRSAVSLGWRTFRVGRKSEPPLDGVEVICPQTDDSPLPYKPSCFNCGLCGGASVKAKSIVIAPHGTGRRFHEERGPERTNPGDGDLRAAWQEHMRWPSAQGLIGDARSLHLTARGLCGRRNEWRDWLACSKPAGHVAAGDHVCVAESRDGPWHWHGDEHGSPMGGDWDWHGKGREPAAPSPGASSLAIVMRERERRGLRDAPASAEVYEAMLNEVAAWSGRLNDKLRSRGKLRGLPPKKLNTNQARAVLVVWLTANGWTIDERARLSVWLSPDQTRRITIGSRSVRVEHGRRGAWHRDLDFERQLGGGTWGSELLLTTAAKHLLDTHRWTDPLRENPRRRKKARR